MLILEGLRSWLLGTDKGKRRRVALGHVIANPANADVT
jgi:hypothetical protein